MPHQPDDARRDAGKWADRDALADRQCRQVGHHRDRGILLGQTHQGRTSVRAEHDLRAQLWSAEALLDRVGSSHLCVAGEALTAELIECQGPGILRERQVLRQHGHVGVLEQFDAFERSAGQRQHHVGDVQFTGFDQTQQFGIVLGLDQIDPYLRPFEGKGAQRGGQQLGAGALETPTRSVPILPARKAARSAAALVRRAAIASPCRNITSPAGVMETGRGPLVRSTNRWPACRSSRRICWLIADWVYPSASAAALNEPVRAISARATSGRISGSGAGSAGTIRVY